MFSSDLPFGTTWLDLASQGPRKAILLLAQAWVGKSREKNAFVFKGQLSLEMFRPCFCYCNSVKQGQIGKM